MKYPDYQRENFETHKPCPQCGFQGEVHRSDNLGHFQWSSNQTYEWENFNIEATPVSKPKEKHAFTPEEVEKAWIELAQHEALFKKVDEWRDAGYFKIEMESIDPVRKQRAHADELRQRLEKYQRPELPQTDQERLKTVDFLLDNVDLLASRQWFKSKKAIEKVVVPIVAMMLDAISDALSETAPNVYN